jgi:hypothetical protein
MDQDIPSLQLSKEHEAAAWEARARLTWGEPQAEIRQSLLEKGLDSQTVERVMAALIRERDTSIRKKGLLNVMLGGGLLAVTIPGLIFYKAGVAEIIKIVAVPARLAAMVLLVLIAGSLVGAVLFLRGLEWLVRGAKTKGADTAVEDTL